MKHIITGHSTTMNRFKPVPIRLRSLKNGTGSEFGTESPSPLTFLTEIGSLNEPHGFKIFKPVT
jgi:hypothetical protein